LIENRDTCMHITNTSDLTNNNNFSSGTPDFTCSFRKST